MSMFIIMTYSIFGFKHILLMASGGRLRLQVAKKSLIVYKSTRIFAYFSLSKHVSNMCIVSFTSFNCSSLHHDVHCVNNAPF